MGYGLGCVPGSLLVARHYGVNLRETSDGNPGAWNALQQLGWARAWPAFVLDGLKGALAGLLGWLLGDVQTAYLAVGAAMLGHAFPLPHPSLGGKSAMTFIGGACALCPTAALPLVAIGIAGFALTRHGVLISRLAVAAYPFAQALVDPIQRVAWTGVLMTMVGILIVARRRPEAGPAPAPR